LGSGPVRNATLRFAHTSTRTDRNGRATVVATLHGRGRRFGAALLVGRRVVARAVVSTARR
jgi:hypothetical protein